MQIQELASITQLKYLLNLTIIILTKRHKSNISNK